MENMAEDFEVVHWSISPNRAERKSNLSNAVVRVACNDREQFNNLVAQLRVMAQKMPISKAVVSELPFKPKSKSVSVQGLASAPSSSQTVVQGPAEKKVLVLGSGFVSGPLVQYLSQRNNVTVASNLLNEAKNLCNGLSNAQAVLLDGSDKGMID
jgi:hypothetical protein